MIASLELHRNKLFKGLKLIGSQALRPALIAIAVGFAISVRAQHWVQTSAPITNWVALTSSADGSKLTALAVGFDGNPGPMFSSADSGITWHPTSAPITNWVSLACSADGQRIVATADAYPGGDAVWRSTNSGVTWMGNHYPPAAYSIASSSDGMKLVALMDYSIVGTSTDGGWTWTTNTLPGFITWENVVSSADGSRLAALAVDPMSLVFWLYSSTNSGTTWDETPGPDPSSSGGSLACSADGNLLVAAIPFFGIFISSDWGQSWQQPNPINRILS